MNVRFALPAFRVIAVLEACSWAGLLLGMAFKYTDNGEAGVQIFGPIHGGFFMAYVVLGLLASRAVGFNARQTLLVLAASIPPFTSLLAERAVARAAARR